jgi:protein-L-isoaspartate O-methyltransferase
MPREKLDIKEIEELGYYDFMGYLEVPFFNIGGAASMDKLIEMCGIKKNSEVLEVDCGTGGNACYIAKATGCHVTGIDIAEHMVVEAKKRAEKEGLTDRVTFPWAMPTT